MRPNAAASPRAQVTSCPVTAAFPAHRVTSGRPKGLRRAQVLGTAKARRMGKKNNCPRLSRQRREILNRSF